MGHKNIQIDEDFGEETYRQAPKNNWPCTFQTHDNRRCNRTVIVSKDGKGVVTTVRSAKHDKCEVKHIFGVGSEPFEELNEETEVDENDQTNN